MPSIFNAADFARAILAKQARKQRAAGGLVDPIVDSGLQAQIDLATGKPKGGPLPTVESGVPGAGSDLPGGAAKTGTLSAGPASVVPIVEVSGVGNGTGGNDAVGNAGDNGGVSGTGDTYRRGGRIARADGGTVVPDDHPVVQQALQIANQAPDMVKAAKATTPQGQTASAASLGRLLDKTRKTQVGRMVDRYQLPTTATAVNRLHGDLRGLAQEGEPGRMWYEKSSKRILDYVGGDKDEAHKLAQLVAIYSPQTTVDVNTANAIKAYNRAKAGHKLWDGEIIDRDKSFDTIKAASDYAKSLGKGVTKVPLDDSGKRFLFARHGGEDSYENIATRDRDLKAHLLMNEGIPFEGRETNNFYRNLMVHIDPSLEQGSTQDLWMARAFGFHDDAVGDNSKYDFMEKLTHKLGAELGWKPHQVQAAIWTAMKTRQEAVKNLVPQEAVEKGIGRMIPDQKTGKTKFEVLPGKEDDYSSLMRERALNAVLDPGHIARSARDFSDFLDRNLAHVSWEATPSKQIRHLNGLEDKPPEVRADYHKRISEALQDDKGQDLLAQYLGMLSPGTVEAPGYWEGHVNPASHLQVAATRIKAAGQRPDIDDASKAQLETYAAARGLLLKQDGVGYHRPHYNPKESAANGIEYQFEVPLEAEHIKRVGKEIQERVPGAGIIPSGPNTLRVLNFSDADDHRPYHKAVDRALQAAHLGNMIAHQRLFASDGDLVTNNWRTSPNGEDYTSRLSAAGRSDVLGYISDVLAPKVRAVDEAFAKEHGLPRDRRLENTLQNLDLDKAPVKPVGPVGLGRFDPTGSTGVSFKKGGAVFRTRSKSDTTTKPAHGSSIVDKALGLAARGR